MQRIIVEIVIEQIQEQKGEIKKDLIIESLIKWVKKIALNFGIFIVIHKNLSYDAVIIIS